ncbi:hypothetical protein PUN4_730017 [Paraburkholderia unamae]|nr:hypothetical protein PUN4_730017 [Paraburkholderia unamae]
MAAAAAVFPAAGLRCLKKSYRMKEALSPGNLDIVSTVEVCITCCKTGEIHAMQQRRAVGINPNSNRRASWVCRKFSGLPA